MLSLLELSGSPFQIGQALGKFGARATHSYLISSSSWNNVMAWRGSNAARAMQALVEQHFPLIYQELQGLAAGLELPLEDVFLWNCRGDVWSMAPDGCTTVQLPLVNGPRITHNEDGDPGFAGYCGIAQAAPDKGPRFVSFVYPASIPGHTFAVNEHGLAITVNNLRSRQVTVGVPRMVLTRALLNQTELPQVAELLRNTQRAGGFHLSVAQRASPGLVSIEFSAQGVSAQSIQAPSLHANHVVHESMQDFPQVVTDSSLHRQQRGNALIHEAGSANPVDINPLRILADQENKQFPIYRNAPDDSDAENTMATADMHIGSAQVDWEVYERPGQSPRFRLIDAQLV